MPAADGPLIFLVSGRPELRTMLVDILGDEGYRIHATAYEMDPLAPLRRLNRPPDLIIVDGLKEPDEGPRFLRRYRESGISGTPIIALTAAARWEQFVDAAEQALLLTVLYKPLEITDLLRTIQDVVRSGGAQRPS